MVAGSNLLWARSAARRARGFGGAAESTELETTLIVKKMKKCVCKNGGTRKNRSLVWGTDDLYARENVEKTDDPRDEMAPRYVHVRAEKRRQELKIRRDTEFRGRVVGLSRVSLSGYNVEFWWSVQLTRPSMTENMPKTKMTTDSTYFIRSNLC